MVSVGHADYDHAFLKNTRARALGNCVRFGASAEHTLAWLDVMVSDAGEDTGGAPVGQPRLPAVIPCSGDGSFPLPFRVDLADPLAAAQAALIAPDFHAVIVGLNDVLRRLRGPNMTPWLSCAQEGGGFEEAGSSGRYGRGSAPGRHSSFAFAYATDGADGGRRGVGSSAAASFAEFGAGDRDHTRAGGASRRGTFLDSGLGGDMGVDPVGATAAGAAHSACCGCGLRANVGPIIAHQEALRDVQAYLTVVNEALAARARAASAALKELQKRQRARRASLATVATAVTSGTGGSAGRAYASAGQAAAAELQDVAAASAPPAEASAALGEPSDDTEALQEALRWVPFGFPNYTCSLHIGLMDAMPHEAPYSRLCLLLLPRDAPPPDADGKWPFYLPYNARPLRVATGPPPASALAAAMPASLARYEGAAADTDAGGVAGLRSPPETTTRPVLAGRHGAGPGTPQRGTGAALASDAGASFQLDGASSASPASSHAALALGLGASPLRAAIDGVAAPGQAVDGAGISGGPAGKKRGGVRFAADDKDFTMVAPPLGQTGVRRRASSTRGAPAGLSNVRWQCRTCSRTGAALARALPSLRNTRNAVGPPLLTATLITLLLLAELLLLGLVLSASTQLAPSTAWTILLLPPLAALLSPLLGLAAVAMRAPWLHRVHASANLMSLLTAAVVLALCVVNVESGPLDDRVGIICPVFLLAAKLAMLPLLHARIAQLDLDADAVTLYDEAVPFVREYFLGMKGGHGSRMQHSQDGRGASGHTGAQDADPFQRLQLASPVAAGPTMAAIGERRGGGMQPRSRPATHSHQMVQEPSVGDSDVGVAMVAQAADRAAASGLRITGGTSGEASGGSGSDAGRRFDFAGLLSPSDSDLMRIRF
jgi:hypothetical protein